MKNAVSSLLFPLHEHLKNPVTIQLQRELERTQWLSPQEVRRLQCDKLERFLENVKENVPFFRYIPTHPAQFEAIPFSTRPVMIANAATFQAKCARKLARFPAGGFSGSGSLGFYHDRRRIFADLAAKLRGTMWWGVDVGDPEVALWGAPEEFPRQGRVRELQDRVFRTKLLSASYLTEQIMDDYLELIRGSRPAHVSGYPSSISLLCVHAARRGVRLDDLGVKVVFCTAERLHDHQRDTISAVFGAPVANGYGTRDAGFIAQQCPHGSLHVADENILLEVLDSRGRSVPEGEPGELVVTHLESHDFPFLRYRTGDIGTLSNRPCNCGRGLTVLQSVEGKSSVNYPAGRVAPERPDRSHPSHSWGEGRTAPGPASIRFRQCASTSTRNC